jgi:DNA-binding PadR family transcriptional regulator
MLPPQRPPSRYRTLSAPTRYAVLGLVARRPTYGYALMQQLRRWSLDPSTVRSSSVYSALSRLEQDELIEARGTATSHGTDRQPRLTYGATEAGEVRLDAWLASPPSTYEELRLRIALARPQDLPLIIGFVIAAERECLARLQELHVRPLSELCASHAPWEALCGAVLGTLDAGELTARAKWLQDARLALESLQSHPARG